MSQFGVYNVKISLNNWKNELKKVKKRQNQIITTSYTWYNFVPVVLYEQFIKVSNFYFLISLVINALIDSPVPFGLNVIPLVIVIIFAMIMRGYEDTKRHYADKEINDQSCFVLRGNRFELTSFESIGVGDLIRCENNNPFPADLLLLFSSRDSNECSVTTVNLDGESNLKTFYGTMPSMEEEEIQDRVQENQWEVVCIDPSEDLHQFHGKLMAKEGSDDGLVLTEKNLLLRGSCLKNTEFVVGCVVYAGRETKLSLNSQAKVLKMSSVDRRLNQFIMFYLGVQVILSVVCGLVWNVLFFSDQWFQRFWYVPYTRIAVWKRVEGFFAFFTLYNRFVPISIIFAVYFLKASATFFFNVDLEMYDEESNQKARVNTIELLEELGQIEYLFCDKTGTLTENKMKFQRCAIDEKEYLDINEELCCLEENQVTNLRKCYKPDLLDLFLCLSLCHTVKVSAQDGSPNNDFSTDLDVSSITYQASSPDELAFLVAMRSYGIAYLGNMKDRHWVSVFGDLQCFIVREVLEFDSNRKCMSVIVDCPDGCTRLICKGAECSLFNMAENSSRINVFMEHLARFAEEGLRVLIVGKRLMNIQEVEDFSRQVTCYRSNPDLIDRQAELYDLVEKKLTLIGVTGIEDKLQEGVPRTIRDLRTAGIKVWIITGDKEETAVNISLSAGHISQDMHIHRFTGIGSEEKCLEKLKSLLYLMEYSPDKSQKYALVVDGKTFSFLIKPVMVSQFSKLCVKMDATLCCRMNPLQKAQAVKMIKDHVKPMPITAAIGDGGNDVSMILEAHIGIGIFGKEGRQAVRVADYAIGKFYFLRRAVLVHGQNIYINTTKLIDFYFYKSALYVFPLIIFCFFSGFSMLNIYDSISVALYSVTYSTLPPMAFALFDKSISDQERLDRPSFYRDNQRNTLMTFLRLFLSLVLALIQALAIFFVTYFVFSQYGGLVDMSGHDQSFFFFGEIIFYSLWIVTLVKLFLIVDRVVFGNIGLFIINILVCFIIQIIYQAFTSSLERSLSVGVLANPLAWLLIFVIVLICSSIDVIIKLISLKKEIIIRDQRRTSYQYKRTK